MKINRNMVAYALITVTLAIGGSSPATANTRNTVTLHKSTSSNRSYTTDYTSNVTGMNCQTESVNGGTDSTSQ